MMTKFASRVAHIDVQSSNEQIGASVSSALEKLLGDKKYMGHTVTPLGSLYFLVTVAYEE